MQEETENKVDYKKRLLNFYNNNKVKIYAILLIFFIGTAIFLIFEHRKQKNNILIADKYVQAGIYLVSKKNEDAKELYEEIVLSENNFYSILALNTIIEKNLILEKNKILEYFSILQKTAKNKEHKDLINLKKALYLMKNSDAKDGNILLKKLIDENSSLKPIALEILKK